MSSFEILRDSIRTSVFKEAEAQVLLGRGSSYYGKIHRLLKAKKIIQLRRGLYAFAKPISLELPNSLLIANLLYGPSYVSLESALSYYQLIPEGVKSVTSVSIKRSKIAKTELGTFVYRKLRRSAFSCGHEAIKINNSNCLIATPEKAILDKLFLDSRPERPMQYLIESLRIEPEDLSNLDTQLLSVLAFSYQCSSFNQTISMLCKEIGEMR